MWWVLFSPALPTTININLYARLNGPSVRPSIPPSIRLWGHCSHLLHLAIHSCLHIKDTLYSFSSSTHLNDVFLELDTSALNFNLQDRNLLSSCCCRFFSEEYLSISFNTRMDRRSEINWERVLVCDHYFFFFLFTWTSSSSSVVYGIQTCLCMHTNW